MARQLPSTKQMSNEHPEGDGNLLNFIASTVEMIRDKMATREGLAEVETRLTSRIDGLEGKADKLEVDVAVVRGELEQVHLRLDGIERAVSSRVGQVEAELSRMRSVLYLLVKDRPDMLRLLGQSPPAGG